MNKKQEVIALAKKNNGVLRTKDFSSTIHNEYLRLLVKENSFDHPERGVYSLKEEIEDQLYYKQSRFQRGIYSHETALFLLGYSDQIYSELVMTFPRQYNIKSVNQHNIKTYRIVESHYDRGIVKIKTAFGNEVNAYSIERTLCDILRPNSKVSIDLITYAYKLFAKSPSKDINALIKYARIFKVENKVKTYLEVLL